MKTPKFPTGLALCLLALVTIPSIAIGAESASVTGILILATDDAGDTDTRLKPYEPTLRRLFRFPGYEQIGRSRTSMKVPGNGVLNFGNEKLLIETTGDGNGSIRANTLGWPKAGRRQRQPDRHSGSRLNRPLGVEKKN